jgi:hypothetical protein
MNVGAMNVVASVAAAPLAQSRGSEIERTQQETVAQERKLESVAEAEAAEGIGVTQEEQAAGDRDADGRRPWEIHETPDLPNDEADDPTSPHQAKDPTGQTGSQLDLCG